MAEYGDKDKATEEGRKLHEAGRRWLVRIKAAEKLEDHWIKDAETAVSAFAMESGTDSSQAYDFNILFANVETIVPAVINSPPAPDIRRRFGDEDPVAKDLAEIYERVIRVNVDDSRLQVEMEAEAQDAFLAGRGIVRLRFKSEDGGEVSREALREAAEDDDAGDGNADVVLGAGTGVSDDTGDSADSEEHNEQSGAASKADEKVTGERFCFEAVSWRDYRHGPAKRWEDRPWDAFRIAMAHDDHDKFADNGLIATQSDGTDKTERGETDDDIIVWEIWCKKDRKVYFVRDVDGVVIKRVDDPLGWTGFFPIATPVQPIELTGRLMPVNPFSVYKKLAEELDITTKRIAILTKEMKVRGWYPGDAADLEAMLKSDDTDFTPISNAEVWAQNGGLQGAVAFWPIDKFIQVLRELYISRNETKQAIYEVTGISDIVRGASDAQETLGAQEIKTQWGSLRIQKMQRMMQRSARDLFVMMSEIIPAKFSHQTLQDISTIQLIPTQQDLQPIPMPPQPPPGAQVPPEMQQQVQQAMQQAQAQEQARQAKLAHMQAITDLMKKPLGTFYRVDVETNSTVRADLTQEKQEMAEFLAGSGSYFAAVAPLVADGTMPKDVAAEIYGATTRMYNLGKSTSDALDRWMTQAKEQAANPQPEKPDPEMIKAQGEQQKLQMQGQIEQGKAAAAQAKAQSDQALAQVQIQTIQAKSQADIAKVNADLQAKQTEAQLSAQGMQAQMAADQRTHALEMQKGALELEKLRVEILKIQAGTAAALATTQAKNSLAERGQDFKESQAKANGKADA